MAEDVKFIINTKVEISWSDGYYKSNIEDVQDNYIAISIPIKEGQYIPLRVGEQLEVFYYPNNEDTFKFNTVVVGRKVDGIPVILLGMPASITRVQRRKFVRVPVICNIQCAVVDKAIANRELSVLANGSNKKLKATLVDLSGGGLRARLDGAIKLNDIILSYIPINTEMIVVKGEVVRIEKSEDNKLSYGINFIEMNEKIRDKIISFIFQLMRDQMRKV